MAPQVRVTHPLRMITQRLSSTPSDQLPYIASHLSKALLDCRSLLSASTEQISNASEDKVLVQKFKTQLVTLSQGKTAAERWTSVLLIKSAVDVGGIEIIRSAGSWVRNLVGFLLKPDPLSTKKAVIITLTRIYLLSHVEPSVVRDITTPTLPSFLTNCLNTISKGSHTARATKVSSPLCKVVLQAFVKLIPHHPSIFRPFIGQIRQVLSPLLAPTPSNAGHEGEDSRYVHTSHTTVGLAQRLYALLPYTAPKNTAAEQWAKSVSVIELHAHRTADHVLRALIEEDPDLRPRNLVSEVTPFNERVKDRVGDELALAAWTGVVAGTERLVGLIQLYQAFIATASQSQFQWSVSSTWKLIERLLSVFGPSSKAEDSSQYTRHKPEADTQEREDLWRVLPSIHSAAMDLILVLLKRLGVTSLGFSQVVLERLLWAFQKDAGIDTTRLGSYRVVTHLLLHVGPSFSEEDVTSLHGMVDHACKDLMSHQSGSGIVSSTIDTKATGGRSSKSGIQSISPALAKAAAIFVEVALYKIPPRNWPMQMRVAVDRTSILTQAKDLMTASALNPLTSSKTLTAAIHPFLARAHPDAPATEALLRPRMPIIRTRAARTGSAYDQDEYFVEETQNQMQVDHPIADVPQPKASTISPASIDIQPHFTIQEGRADVTGHEPTSLQSPKRTREIETATITAQLGHEPEMKRPRIEDEILLETAREDDSLIEQQDRGKAVATFKAPSPIADPIARVATTSENGVRTDAADDSSGSESGASLQLDLASDLELSDEEEVE